MGKRRNGGDQGGAKLDPNAWMATLSDLVFLLITFFVLLISMGSMDTKRLREAFGFFDQAVDVLGYPREVKGTNRFMEVINPLAVFTARALESGGPDPRGREAAARKLIGALSENLAGTDPASVVKNRLKPLAKAAAGTVTVEILDGGFSVALPGRLVFEPGARGISEEGAGTLSDIATIARLWGGEVEIVGRWPWHEGAPLLAMIAEHLERQWVRGSSLTPELLPGYERTVTFILRKR
jgi:hypothetical protein